MTVSKIAVIGAGTMGNGIAQVAAVSDHQVVMIDVAPDALERGRATIASSIARLHSKGRITADQKAAAEAIATSTELAAAADADIAIEAVVETLEVKRQVFSQLDRITRPEVILATNTSSISITEIAVNTEKQPNREGCQQCTGSHKNIKVGKENVENCHHNNSDTGENRYMPVYFQNITPKDYNTNKADLTG